MLSSRFAILITLFAAVPVGAGDAVVTPRPVPPTRPEMKQMLEDMKSRPYRIPVPELTEAERQRLGDRAGGNEGRLRYHYIPWGDNNASGAGGIGSGRNQGGPPDGPAAEGRARDTRRNADENMTLSYPFKTMLFWIVSRTNNCQYCLGHQEQKLSAAGLTEDEIAALDSNWSRFSPAEQAAFAYARKLTYEPNLLSDADIAGLRAHYTDLQILEMTMSVAGNNATNRWKEGTGIPQSSSGIRFFSRDGQNPAADRQLPVQTYLTPTPPEFVNVISIVAPMEFSTAGQPTGRGISTRPPLESRAEVQAALASARTRSPRLPLLSDEEARHALGKDAPQGAMPLWLRLVANFPNDVRRRLPTINAINFPVQTPGDLTPLLKAQISWIVGRQDRAWYATGLAMQRLRELGQTDDQIFALDGNWEQFSPADRALFKFARHQAATPVALTDADVAEALELTGPRQVVQLIDFVTGRVYLDRVTEAAGLPWEGEI